MKHPRLKPDMVLRQEEDGAFLFDPARDVLVCVNETGLEIVRGLDDGRSLDEIITLLCDLYPDVESDTLQEDALSFISELVERGLAES
jgi:hypothetical protein